MTHDGPRADEVRIRAQVDLFRAAFRAKDVDGIMSVFAPDIVSFDLVPPLVCVGDAALRHHWQRTFASYRGPIAYEIRGLAVAVSQDVAFTHSLNRKSGTLTTGEMSEQ